MFLQYREPLIWAWCGIGSGHDLSPLLRVVEAVGVAPEGAQLITSGLSTKVAETIF